MSAKNKLLIFIGVLFTVAIGVIATLSYYSFREASVNNHTERLQSQARLISEGVEQYMARYFDVLILAEHSIEVEVTGRLNEAQILKELKVINDHFAVSSSFLGLKDGTTYLSNGVIKDFNARRSQREWYIRSMAGEENIVTKPFRDTAGNVVISLAMPVMRSGQIVGAVGVTVELDSVGSFARAMARNDRMFVTYRSGYIISAKYPDYVGQNIYDKRPSYSEYRNKSGSVHEYDALNGTHFFVANAISDKLDWIVWSFEEGKAIAKASDDNLTQTATVSLVLLCLVLSGLYYLVIRLMYRPIGGEPGEIAEIARRVSEGDLSLADMATGKEVGIHGAVMAMVVNLRATIEGINVIAGQLAGASSRLSDTALSVSDSSGSQTIQLEQVSTAMSEMSATVDEVARSTLEASNSANTASENASLGKNVVSEMNAGIDTLVDGLNDVVTVSNELAQETHNVTSILEVINSISEQTNLLALNAAIEAARAGEHGRGFAVVADEVRQLATRTKESIGEIQTMLTSLQEKSDCTGELMKKNMEEAERTKEQSDRADAALNDIQASIDLILGMGSQIATATEEQSHVAQEINVSVVEVNELAKSTLKQSESNSNQAQELSEVATALSQSVNAFKL